MRSRVLIAVVLSLATVLSMPPATAGEPVSSSTYVYEEYRATIPLRGGGRVAIAFQRQVPNPHAQEGYGSPDEAFSVCIDAYRRPRADTPSLASCFEPDAVRFELDVALRSLRLRFSDGASREIAGDLTVTGVGPLRDAGTQLGASQSRVDADHRATRRAVTSGRVFLAGMGWRRVVKHDARFGWLSRRAFSWNAHPTGRTLESHGATRHGAQVGYEAAPQTSIKETYWATLRLRGGLWATVWFERRAAYGTAGLTAPAPQYDGCVHIKDRPAAQRSRAWGCDPAVIEFESNPVADVWRVRFDATSVSGPWTTPPPVVVDLTIRGRRQTESSVGDYGLATTCPSTWRRAVASGSIWADGIGARRVHQAGNQGLLLRSVCAW